MSVRLIAGRAGSGKTHWCQSRICEQLRHSIMDGSRLVMLVPEQAALQIERGLLAMAASPVLGRCEVLSFRRLAHRILNELSGPSPVLLSPTGRQAALRRLLGRRRNELKEFHRVADRAGFITAVSRGISELLQEAATIDQLQAAATRAESDGDPSARRLHDMAIIYRDYLDYLGNDRVDPEGVLDLARERLDRSDWLGGAMIWVDGFAGLTQQQVRMLVSLAQQASQIDLAFMLDSARVANWDGAGPVDELSLFARMERTWQVIRTAMIDASVTLDPPVLLTPPQTPRFASSPALSRLELSLFSVSRAATGDFREPSKDHEPAATADAVRLVLAADRRTEVIAAVKSIVDLVQSPSNGLRYRDIAIIVRSLEPYHDLLSAELAAHGIPFFMDRRRPTHPHALIRLIREAMALHLPMGFGAAVTAMLKTGLTPFSDEDADELENYVLAYGLSNVMTWRDDWTYSPRPGDNRISTDGDIVNADLARRLARLNGLRACLLELIGDWGPVHAAGVHPKAATWLSRLWAMFERMKVNEQLAAWRDAATASGDHDHAAEHEQAWTSVVRLLDELHDALGDEQMTARQFRECIEAGLSEFTLALAPSTLDQVLVSAVDRSRHPPVKAALVLGMSETDFPSLTNDDGVLGDDERAALSRAGLEMSTSAHRRNLDERMLAYIAVTRASERLWVSCPRVDEKGRALRPSPYWADIRAAAPDAREDSIESFGADAISTQAELAGRVAEGVRDFCEERLIGSAAIPWLTLYDWSRGAPRLREEFGRAMASLRPVAIAKLSAQAAGAMWPPPYKTNVSAIEKYAACPFKHFADRGLKLSPRVEHEIKPADLGTIYHSVMEEFVERLRTEGSTLRELSTGEIVGRVSALCEQAVRHFAEQMRMDESQQRLATWRGRRELPAAVEGQKRTVGQSPLAPERLEQIFGLQRGPEDDGKPDPLPALELTLRDGRKVLLRGRIDRIDLLRTGNNVIGVVYDYKRSITTKRLSLDKLWHGLSLQLVAYLLILKYHGEQLAGAKVIPGGAFYLPLIAPPRPINDLTEISDAGFNAYKEFGPRGIVDFDWINAIDPTLTEGSSRVFSAFAKKGSGEAGNIDKTDVAISGTMDLLLDYVRSKMTDLCESWLAGDIAVSPFVMGTQTACAHCDYRSVCRIENIGRSGRLLPAMSRMDVMKKLSGDSAPADTPEQAPSDVGSSTSEKTKRPRRNRGGEP